ncbi:NAD(P)/FAD-dependent oxidoreductase [Rhodococcus coprophilus]|uniref:Oxidoreductase n=1 Tax=Rhodococcus coprophilus TaxID=38310 RepID=A0A2X4UDN1_9NOCA|nr:FAD-dependent oxidoreductase [Rhodococcus coprophilus]MBM7459657.1 D-amino-acid dehydrogenase [Rhodococcus coprophilus]SQI36921.1 oxidoreductase [Rhodococcus coprophilus]
MAVRRVVVVGAGAVGLSAAWFLQEHDVEVSVLDRAGVAADASWGNAGWLAPALTLPLPSPEVLRYGMRSMFTPSSPVYVPPTTDLRLARFLLGFARHCTARQWQSTMAVFAQLNRRALDAYDDLAHGGRVAETTRTADPFLAAFTSDSDRDHLVAELEQARAAGSDIEYDLLDGTTTRSLEPLLGEAIGAGVRIRGQRYIDPPRFADALATSVRERGGEIVTGFDAVEVRDTGGGVVARAADGDERAADAVVLATGARLNALARPFGVRTPVQAGRGYSFSVLPVTLPKNPIYFPAQRVACTPLHDRFRVAGMMEFRNPDTPLDPRRVRAIVDATRPLLRGVDWEARREEWVGSRPCSVDGLPLVGATRSKRVFVAGGHGMWGIALGPTTGRMLANAITGQPDPLLKCLDPLR